MTALAEGQSKAERVYVHDGIDQNIRGDGRKRDDVRDIQLALGIIDTAQGSALLSLGGTEVLAVVKAEVGRPSELAPRCGRIQCSVELPAGDDRLATEDLASDLASALERAIAGPRPAAAAIDLEALCIQHGQRCWVLFIDVLVLNADGAPRAGASAGNELDAMSIAAKAALADVKIPKVTVVAGASADEPAELELDDDPGVAVRLGVREVPVLVTVSKCGRHYVVDTTGGEQAHVDSAVTLAVTEAGAVRGAANRGSVGLPAAAAQEMMTLARKTGATIQKELRKFLLTAASGVAAQE